MDTVDLTLRLWNNPVDLTLRLGLPLSDNSDQNPILDDHLPHNHNNTFLSHASQAILQEAMYQLGMVNQRAMVQGQEGFDGTQNAPLSNHMVSNMNHMNYAYVFNQTSGLYIGFPSYGTNCINLVPAVFCGRHYHLLPEMTHVTMNNYTLIEVPCRRATAPTSHEQELGIASASTVIVPCGCGDPGCQRRIKDLGPNRRCTNYYCNTDDTPMWRKGPLGPKTLCNNCGIKYRKKEKRRKAREAREAARAARQLIRNRRIQRN